MDQDRGLVTQHVSKHLERWCEEVHLAFLAAQNLNYWYLSVIGLERQVVAVTSEAPSGDVLGPKQIQVTLGFREDLRALLDSHCRQHHHSIPAKLS
jgi:hypothetical protein